MVAVIEIETVGQMSESNLDMHRQIQVLDVFSQVVYFLANDGQPFFRLPGPKFPVKIGGAGTKFPAMIGSV